MKKALLPVLILFLALSTSRGQQASLLHQIQTNSQLIELPLVFRQLQVQLDSTMGQLKPGLRVPVLYQRMSSLRSGIIRNIPHLKLESKLTISVGKDTVRLPIPVSEDEVLRMVRDTINVALMKAFSSFKLSDKEAVFAALLQGLQNYNANTEVPSKMMLETFQSKLSWKIACVIESLLESRIAEETAYRGAVDSVNFYAPFSIAVNTLDEKIHQIVVDGLDKAEQAVTKAVNDYSSLLVSGCSGISVSEGEGAFAGGLIVSFLLGPSGRIAVYTNGAFAKGDTNAKTSAQSLFGIEGSCAWDSWELDVLSSALFGDKNVQPWNVFELGVGVSKRLDLNVIVGLAYYAMTQTGAPGTHTIGLMLKGASQGAPAILGGIAIRDRKVTPTFQVSFPILPK